MPSNRALLMLIALVCFFSLGAALYLQHVKELMPCPLCVIQRYALFCGGLFALVGACGSNLKIWSGAALASVLVGAGYLAKQFYVLANPGLSCGIDPMETMLNKIPTATYLPWLFHAQGLCEDARDLVLGLSVPAWSAVAYTIVIAGLITVLARKRA